MCVCVCVYCVQERKAFDLGQFYTPLYEKGIKQIRNRTMEITKISCKYLQNKYKTTTKGPDIGQNILLGQKILEKELFCNPIPYNKEK